MRNIFVSLFAMASLMACASDTVTGSWMIERAEPAPWVAVGFVPDPGIVNRYVGQTVHFHAGRIDGPALLACSNPNYVYGDVPAEGLFQGGLAEDAGAAAAKLGFVPPVRTLTTSCEHDIAFYLRDSGRATFALDNVIFWMVRQKQSS